MTLLRHLHLLPVVRQVLGPVSPRPLRVKLAARRSSSSSSSSSLVSSSPSSSNSRRRPMSPTAAQETLKFLVPVATFLESPFKTLLLLFLLDARDANESHRQRQETQPAGWSFPTTPTSPHVLSHRVNKFSRKHFLISQIQSAGTRETLTNHWSLLHLPTQIQWPMTIKGAFLKRKRHYLSQIPREGISLTVVLDQTFQLSDAS